MLTVERSEGRVTLPSRRGALIRFVSQKAFDRLSVGVVTTGRFYCSGTARGGMLLICNRSRPDRREIHRDDAWQRRVELWNIVHPLLINPADDEAHQLPLELLGASYLEAFPAGATLQDTLAEFTRNTQQRIEEAVDGYLAETAQFDSVAYLQHGVLDPAYSHIGLFGYLYAAEIRWILRLLEELPQDRTLKVLDIGCGACHFLLTLSRCLRLRGLQDRVELVGLDSSDRDARFGVQISQEREWRTTFERFDLMAPDAADRLRRYRADILVLNHVLEHLPGPIENRWLHDLMLAARVGLAVALPLNDPIAASLSKHSQEFTDADLWRLSHSFPARCAGAVRSVELVENADRVGLMAFQRLAAAELRLGDPIRLPTRIATLAPTSSLYEDFRKPFDLAEFDRKRRAPTIARIADIKAFSRTDGPGLAQVRQLLIKVPGSDVVLPGSLEQFQEAVELITSHNAAVNPGFNQMFAYLNVFRGIARSDGYRGLSLSCHGDQLQTLNRNYAFCPDWSYIASSSLPTTLYEQAFDLSDAAERWELGEEVELYDYLNAQARPDARYYSTNFEILLLSPYIVHSATPAERPIPRVFLKIAFSSKRFWDNREFRQSEAFPIDDWYQEPTVGRIDGFLSHGHWNERFLRRDICGS